MKEKLLYVGIDVSKKTLDVALAIDTQNTISSIKVGNNPTGYSKIVNHIQKNILKYECSNAHLCLESTGIYNEKLVEFIQEKFIVSVVNPSQTNNFAKTTMLRIKNDKSDAKMIALYAATMNPKPLTKTRKELNQFRKLVRFLSYLKDERASQKTRLEAATLPFIEEIIRENISHLTSQIEKTEKSIKEIVKNCPDLREKHKLILSVKGIGESSAWILLSEFHIEDGGEKLSPKAQTAHAGLAPKEHTSGTSINKKSRICKIGNSRIRKALFFPTMCALQHNPLIQEFYTRLIKKGKSKMIALVAAMRKLLVICVGVLNNKVPFDPDWLTKKGVLLANG